MHLLFWIQSLQLLIWSRIWIMFFYVFICEIINVKYSGIVFIILYSLIFSFLHIRSLLVPYAPVSIELIDCILLSSFELKSILLISLGKTLCLSLLNLCLVFNITFSYFVISLRLSTSIFFFSKELIIFSI